MTSNLRAETIYFDSYDDQSVEAYLATTESDEPVGGVVVIHHFPGYDEATQGDRSQVRREWLQRHLRQPLLAVNRPERVPMTRPLPARARGGVPDDSTGR